MRDGEIARAHLNRNNDKTNDAEDAFKFRFLISYIQNYWRVIVRLVQRFECQLNSSHTNQIDWN